MFLYHLICICNQLFNYMLPIIYCILLYYTGSKYLWAVQFIRSKTIEPAVQPVINGWISEPVNRWPYRFNLRSDPNNMKNSKKGTALLQSAETGEGIPDAAERGLE